MFEWSEEGGVWEIGKQVRNVRERERLVLLESTILAGLDGEERKLG